MQLLARNVKSNISWPGIKTFSAQSSLCSFTNVFQERDMRRSAAVTSSLFKENVTKLLICKQTYHWRQKWMTEITGILSSLQYPIPNGVSLKLDARFSYSYLSKMEFSTIKTVKSKYWWSLTDKHTNDCLRVAIAKYPPNYHTLVEETHFQVSHCILQFCLERLLSWDTIYPHTARFNEWKQSPWSITYISYIIICFSCSLCLVYQFSCYIFLC